MCDLHRIDVHVLKGHLIHCPPDSINKKTRDIVIEYHCLICDPTKYASLKSQIVSFVWTPII
jgi:hypothetical protein